MFDNMKFANALIKKRTDEQLSLVQAAKASGIEKTNIFRAETGQLPKLDVYFNLCQWLGKPMDFFFNKPKSSKNGKGNS